MSLFPPDDDPLSQGARAGQSGSYLESRVEAAFDKFGVRAVRDNPEYHWEKDIFSRREKLLVRQPLLRGIHPDFLYIDFRRNLRLPIECRQQIGSGSTDRKLYYTIDDLIGLEYGVYWLIVAGGGFSKRVMHKVQNKIAATNNKKVRGRLLYDELLFRAIQYLVDRGEV